MIATCGSAREEIRGSAPEDETREASTISAPFAGMTQAGSMGVLSAGTKRNRHPSHVGYSRHPQDLRKSLVPQRGGGIAPEGGQVHSFHDAGPPPLGKAVS